MRLPNISICAKGPPIIGALPSITTSVHRYVQTGINMNQSTTRSSAFSELGK